MDMCYSQIPDELDPFDYEEYNKKKGTFYGVVTNCRTGKAEYLPLEDMHEDIQIIRASSSLPFMSKMVEIGGEKYLDGGVSDSIPVKRARKDGNDKVVVILTRDPSYKKGPSSIVSLAKLKYRKYPNLVKAMEQRHVGYNKTLSYIREGVKAGKIFVIQPQEPVAFDRIEKDRKKLIELYKQGCEDAKRQYKDLLEFLEAE